MLLDQDQYHLVARALARRLQGSEWSWHGENVVEIEIWSHEGESSPVRIKLTSLQGSLELMCQLNSGLDSSEEGRTRVRSEFDPSE